MLVRGEGLSLAWIAGRLSQLALTISATSGTTNAADARGEEPPVSHAGILEAERVFDVLAGGPEHLSVHVDQPTPPERPAMPSLPSDRSGDGVSPRLSDALVQIQVTDRMRHDGRSEH